MTKRLILRLLLATTFLLTAFASPLAHTGAALASLPTSNSARVPVNTAAGGAAGVPTVAAQITATPAPYPSPEGKVAPAATVAPGELTPSPSGGYPAGANVDGTDRVGGDDRQIPGTDSENDETAGAAASEQSGTGNFILWLGFIFSFAVFVASIFFSIFLSERDRRSDL